MGKARKLLGGSVAVAAFVIGTAGPVLAHDCINVSAKTENASVGTYNVATDTFTPDLDAKGNKPFVTVDATGVGGGTFLLYVHPAGPHGVLPSATKSDFCKEQGVTSIEACFGP